MHIGTLPGLTEAFASLLEDPRASLIFERIQDQPSAQHQVPKAYKLKHRAVVKH